MSTDFGITIMLCMCVHKSYIMHTEGKVFCGQEPPSGQSTTTECEVIYQLLAVIN